MSVAITRRIDPEFYVGLDLGQSHDPTALAIVERRVELTNEFDSTGPKTELQYRVLNVERVSLGTPYPRVVERVTTILNDPKLTRTYDKYGTGMAQHIEVIRPALVVDATGVGRPVVDLFEQVGLSPIAVTITGGDATNGQGQNWRIPKGDLVSTLNLAFEHGQLKIPTSLPLRDVLINELTNLTRKISHAGHDSYSAWRENIHDDLVLALALAVWRAENDPPVFQSIRLEGV